MTLLPVPLHAPKETAAPPIPRNTPSVSKLTTALTFSLPVLLQEAARQLVLLARLPLRLAQLLLVLDVRFLLLSYTKCQLLQMLTYV